MFNMLSVYGGVCAAEGFYADAQSAGLRPNGANDVAFIYSDTLCDVASVFTTNKMQAAPIKHFKEQGTFKTNFVLMNAKNANAMTGKEGVSDIVELLGEVVKEFPQIENPIMSSTGVIGVRLPKEKILKAAEKFDLSRKESSRAAEAIMTTDTFKKEIAFRVELEDGGVFHIGGIAKGAGMINPAMATMLCFITTDADLSQEQMQAHLNEHVETTFNAISVDGDTSTNDTVLLLSNKKSGVYNKEAFSRALKEIMLYLALQMVKDGEGAKKLVAFEVKGAKDDAQAQIAAKKLSDSLLVKTAIFGEDPNWGRIASTIGASGIEAYEEKLTISYNDVTVYDQGVNLFTKEVEEKAFGVMKQSEFKVICDLHVGEGTFMAYGCDLGYEYVKINADYRT